MAIYRTTRLYASTPPAGTAGNPDANSPAGSDDLPTARDLQEENMKMQRQIMQNQRQAQALAAQERQNQFRRQYQQQKLEQARDVKESRENLAEKKLDKEDSKGGGKQSLVKQRTEALKPIPMGK